MTKKDWRGPSERANHRLLWLCGAIGGVMGLVMGVAARRGSGDPHLSIAEALDAPLPGWLSLTLAVVWGVVVPIISWRWHRVVDEHERIAYKDGALAGFQIICIVAPVWWLLWRGGLAPAVNGYVVYAATTGVAGIVWIWRKYA